MEDTTIIQEEPTTIQTEPTPSGPVPTEPKAEKRGRHRLDCQCEKCAAKRTPAQPQQQQPPAQQVQGPKPATAGVYDANPFNMSEYQTTAVVNPETSQPEQVNVGKFITGGLVLVVANSLVPMTVLKLLKWIDPEASELGISSSDIKLDDDQIKDLEPLANEAIKTVVMDLPPMQALLIVLGLVYTGNTTTAVLDAKSKKKERDALKQEKIVNKLKK
jgi:hypothetical protein